MSDSVSVPINGQGKEGDRRTKPHGLYGHIVGSRPYSQRRVVIGLYLGERRRCVVDADCYVTCQGGRGGGKEQKTSFLKKGT